MKRKSKHGYIVAIDGPSGAGKSTVSGDLAEALGGQLLDTGAMYRSVAYYSLRSHAKTSLEFGKISRRLQFDVSRKGNALLVNGKDLGQKLRTEKVSEMASYVSKFKSVRQILTRRQRALGKALSKKFPVVVEGRDIGSVVFPRVEFKFFVMANPRVRAERRLSQLRKQGIRDITLKAILKQNRERDKQDSSRKLAPLKCPDDAIVVDTSTMAIGQVVQFMKAHIEQRYLLSK